MRNRLFPRLGILCGVLSVIFAIVVLAGGGAGLKEMETGTRTSYEYYGGDAYPGMQQAAADTARNVKTLSEIVKAGFQGVSSSGMGFLLLILGCWLIVHSLHVLDEMQAREQFEAKVLTSIGQFSAQAALLKAENEPAPQPVPAVDESAAEPASYEAEETVTEEDPGTEEDPDAE